MARENSGIVPHESDIARPRVIGKSSKEAENAGRNF